MVGQRGWHGAVDGEIPAEKLKEFRAKGKPRQVNDDEGAGVVPGSAAPVPAEESGTGSGRVPGDAAAARRDRAAAAAQSRVVQAQREGIGEASRVERWRQRAAEQAEAGTAELFGASSRDALRDALERNRREQAAGRVGEGGEPVLGLRAGSVPGSFAGEASARVEGEPPVQAPVGSPGERCELCFRLGGENVRGSPECIALQRNLGCHACGRCGCWRESNLCAYMGRARVEHPDGSASGVAAPHMFERESVSIERHRNRTVVRIGGRVLFKGAARGSDNNCLIYALHAAIQDYMAVLIDVPWIRSQLRLRFPEGGPREVTELSFLDLRSHWEHIVSLIGQSAESLGCARGSEIRPESFRITCVEEGREVIGDVVGEGRTELFILNERFLHFVPLLLVRGWR